MASSPSPEPADAVDVPEASAASRIAASGSPDVPPDAPPVEPDDEAPRVLLVEIGGALWALPSAHVRAVVRSTPLTALAGAPAWVLGVAAVRGAVLPVGDLARRAGVEAPAARREAWWVLVEAHGRAAALAGTQVRTLEPTADEAPADRTPDLARRDAPADGLPVAGLTRLRSEGEHPLPPAVPVLDVAAVLDELHDDGG